MKAAEKMALPKECAGKYFSVVADLIGCSGKCEEVMSGQGSLIQAVTGTIALGVVYDSSNSQVALGDAKVHMDIN